MRNLMRNSNKIATVGNGKTNWAWNPGGHRRKLTMRAQILLLDTGADKTVTVRDVQHGKNGKVYGFVEGRAVMKDGYANQWPKCPDGSTPGLWVYCY